VGDATLELGEPGAEAIAHYSDLQLEGGRVGHG
jgi:hypothetical protein